MQNTRWEYADAWSMKKGKGLGLEANKHSGTTAFEYTPVVDVESRKAHSWYERDAGFSSY